MTYINGEEQFTYEEILENFNLKIKKSINAVPYQERDDLEQEIKIKIYEKLDTVNNIKCPGFYDYIYNI